jgi:N-acyl-D-aspartate/D-glutamate deacylase
MGMDIAADMYPYIAGATELSALLPYWMHNEGNQKLLERLGDPAIRARIKKEMEKGGEEFSPENLTGGYDGLLICLSAGHPEYQGKTVRQISEELRKDPIDTVMDIVLESNCLVFVNIFDQTEDNVKLFMQHPRVMFGSDASSFAPYGILGMAVFHPRTYGTFPRVLAKYVRQEKILTLPEAIRKMTSLSASRWGIKDRGVVAKGKKADLVLFNASAIEDRATYENPNQYPVGIKAVIVNGKIVVEDDEHTGALPGRVLTR